MNIRNISCITLGCFVLLLACNKKEEVPVKNETPVFNPTPHTISYPSWVKIYSGQMPEPADNATTVEGVSLGRKLFYDKKLSDDMSMSCASCHKIENAFSDPRAFSTGTNGAFGDRNAMAVINMGWSTKFFWDGRRPSLELQAHDPVTNAVEMRNTWPVVVSRLQADPVYPGLFFKAFGKTIIDSNMVTKAIAQFERTLVSFNSRFDKFYFEGDTSVLSDQEKRGKDLFFGKADCNHCHSDAMLTDHAFRNNGLDATLTDIGLGKVTGQSTDNGKFKVPTLRNIALTFPYMHDSRFITLEQVVDFYDHQVKTGSPNLDVNMDQIKNGLNLTAQEKLDLVAFLKTFTDSSFITNAAFMQP